MKVLDKAGNEIKIGDFIVYGHALGRCAGLRYGKVLEFKETEISPWNKNKTTHLKVIGVDDDWIESIRLNERPGTLQFPESRVLIVSENQIPARFLELLKSYKN